MKYLFYQLLLIAPLSLGAQQLHLPASSNWLNLGEIDLTGDNVTFEALIYMEDVPISLNKFDILSKHENISNTNYFFRHTNFGITTYDNGDDGPTTFYNLFSEFDYELYRLYHVAASYDGQTMRYYVNGCLVNSLPATGQLFQNDFPTGLGQRWIIEDEQFIGHLDEVRIWDTVRSPEEIATEPFLLDTPQSQAGLVAYYQFEGNFVNQAAPGVYDGVPQGSPLLSANPAFSLSEISIPDLQLTHADCESTTGSIVVADTLPAFEYALNDLDYSGVAVWDGLLPGSYTVSVRRRDWCLLPVLVTTEIYTTDVVNILTEQHLCSGDSVLVGSQWVYSAGWYDTLLPATDSECDTLLTYHLTESPPSDHFAAEYVICGTNTVELTGPVAQTTWTTETTGASYTVTSPGTYIVQWIDEYACFQQESFLVSQRSLESTDFYIPNIFSPNSDGVNDRFQVQFPAEITPLHFEMNIFDRWGNLIHRSQAEDEMQGWDGMFLQREMDTGAYVYTVSITIPQCDTTITVQEAGSVQLVR